MKNLSLLKKSIFAFLFTLLISGQPAKAQVLIPGMDAVVTMYGSGLNKPVAMVKRVGDPLGAGAPFSSVTQWMPPPVVPAITAWTTEHMGQVFGTTIDKQGSVFFAATAMYYNVPFGFPEAKRMAMTNVVSVGVSVNGFHAVVGGDIGLIYKASNTNLNTINCIVTAKSTIAGTGSGTTSMYNTGFGIGNIAYSSTYDRLYASNLEDGKIYCINPATGNIDGVFDPLLADIGTSGIAPIGERIFAVGVNSEFDGTTRLYYSVLISSGLSCQSVIRSVELTAGGNFASATDALEFNLPVSDTLTYISDIAFSVRGEMLVAEKGDPHNAHVYQYYGHHSAWSLPQDLPASNFSTMRNSGGGVDYGFIKANGMTVCDSLIWTMENAMNNTKWYGMQSIPHNGYAPFTGTGFGNQAYIVDLDQDSFQVDNPKSKFGDIVFFDSSCSGTGPTNICDLVSVNIVKDAGAGCCYSVYTSNKYHGEYFTALKISTNHLNIDNVAAGSTWGGITYQSSHTVSFGDTSHHWNMPKDSMVGGGFLLARICVSGTDPDVLKVKWIGNAPQFDTVCEKEIPIDGCGVPVDTNCVAVINQKAICENGVVKMQFQVRNNSAFTMRSVTMFAINPDVKTVGTFLPIADLLPGNTSPVYTIPLIVKNNAKTGCFFFSACDLNVFPGTSGQYPKFCCMDSIEYCIDIPECDSCDAIEISAIKRDSTEDCCYNLTLSNNLPGATISCIRFQGLGGAQFALFSGWNIQSPVSSSKITVCAPGSGIGNGAFPDFANFCITGTSATPYRVSVEFLNKAGAVICTRILEFSNCQLVKPTCANIINDSMYCDGNKNKYSFHIKNNSSFPLYQVDLRLSDTSFKLDRYLIIPDTPIQPGDIAGPYLISIDSSTEGNNTFCMYLTGHNNIYIPDSLSATLCCTDSLGVICLPFINCDSQTCCTTCCEFANLVIPSGITPNNDGYNETLVIENSALCSAIKITVFNRWGNIVFRDDHYANNWTGTNMKGEKLPQGTYFIVIELANGSKKATYIDIRY